MDKPASLPLPVEQLPANIRRFAASDAPLAARLMAARGLVPVQGADQVSLLVQLTGAAEAQVADTARTTLQGLPEATLHAASEAPLHAVFLDYLAKAFASQFDVLERVARNAATGDFTLERLAATGSEALTEIIALNQRRLLECPRIIEALYANRNTRMSTADRLVELAARNGVRLDAIPAFDAHVAAIAGELIPEPTAEPLPGDRWFNEALEADSEDDDVMVGSQPPEGADDEEEPPPEEVREKFRPLHTRIREMRTAEKIRLAMVGDAAARALLVRDPNKTVAHAAIASPRMKDSDVIHIAQSRDVSQDVLRYITNRKQWVRSYEVKRALVGNPKTLSRSRGIAQSVKTAAKQRLLKIQRGG